MRSRGSNTSAAPLVESLTSDVLNRLQRELIDPRFADNGWRDGTVCVGESFDLVRHHVHYAAPRQEDVGPLMDAFFELSSLLHCESVDAVVAAALVSFLFVPAALVSFLFVLIHPFSDGNGRIHRWLIHWTLSRRGVTPSDIVLPVSAVMLSRRREYDAALETFSVPLMKRIASEIGADGRMTLHGETVHHYRHPDLTAMVGALWSWLQQTVDEELSRELDFLVRLDAARREMQTIVDMPDRLITLFIKLCRQNGGVLSAKKRAAHFDMLEDAELVALQVAVAEGFGGDGAQGS